MQSLSLGPVVKVAGLTDSPTISSLSGPSSSPGLCGELRRQHRRQRPVGDFAGQRKHFRSIGGEDAWIRSVGRGRPGRAIHPVQVITHRGQRGAECLVDTGRLRRVTNPETEHEPAWIRLGQ